MKAFFTKKSSSLTYLSVTQFLGALNDNIFKFLIVYFCIDLQGIEKSTQILAAAGAIFVIPFLLFSSTSGMLADRFSKRNIIVWCKVMELMVMSLGVLALTLHSVFGGYTILFLMATQSALFGPSKYGIIPELVENQQISRANGLITSMTFLAIIIGTFLASFITDITNRNFIVSGLLCVAVSTVGLATSFCIEYTPPAGSLKKIHPWFLIEIYKTTKMIRQHPTLLTVVLGSAYFMFAGAFMQLNMIPFAIKCLHLTDVQGGYLFLLAAFGIGAGSITAGRLSGKAVELGLIPLGGLGMVAGGFLLDFWSDKLFLVIPVVILLGFFSGLYLIPLDAFIQIASPPKERGQVVATTNFFGFFGVLCASGALFLINRIIGLNPDKGFSLLGWLTIGVTIAISIITYDYLTRYLAMILARLHFKMKIKGLENVSLDKPSIFICNHTAWNDTLLLLGAQAIPMHFIAEQEMEHSEFIKRLYRLLKIVHIPSITLIKDNMNKLEKIRKTLKKGVSVCIFLEEGTDEQGINKIQQYFDTQFEGTPYSTVTVTIEKGEKKPTFFRMAIQITEKNSRSRLYHFYFLWLPLKYKNTCFI